MADVASSGLLNFSDGTVAPMYRSDLAEGTLEEVQTDADFTTVVQSIGDYAPGKTVVGGIMTAKNNIAYAYISRQGQPATIIMVAKTGVVGSGTFPCKPFRLQAGDKLEVLSIAAATRTLSVGVWCNDGTQRVFTVLGASGTVTPVDSITGNGLGATLEGKSVKSMFMTSIDGTLNTSAAGVVAINAQGAPIGAVAASSPITESPKWSPCNIPVKLNYAFKCTFSA